MAEPKEPVVSLNPNCDNTGPGQPITDDPVKHLGEVDKVITMLNTSWAVSTGNELVTLTDPNGSTWALSPEAAWDLGDDLLIASGRVWQEESGQPYTPDWANAETDKNFLDERATGVLFNDDQIADLRDLATERGMTVPQLIRQEMVATLEFSRWAEDLQVAEHAEGENGDGHAVPAVDDPVAETEAVTQAEDGSNEVKDHGKHRPTPPPGGIIV